MLNLLDIFPLFFDRMLGFIGENYENPQAVMFKFVLDGKKILYFQVERATEYMSRVFWSLISTIWLNFTPAPGLVQNLEFDMENENSHFINLKIIVFTHIIWSRVF